MTASDRLAELLGADRAAAARSALEERNLTIEVDDDANWTPRGHTGARLGAVIIQYATGEHRKPQRCVAKLCPPNPHIREGAKHREALRVSPKAFAERHLVDQPYDPVRCSDGWVIIFQDIAGGSLRRCELLSELPRPALSKACATIRKSLLNEWTGYDFGLAGPQPLPELLRHELGRSIEQGGWLQAWAAPRGLLDPAHIWIEMERDGVLPNPLGLLLPNSPAATETITCRYLTGRCHGDLHGGNILVPRRLDGTFDPGAFRLIDLTTFADSAPLSRDIATLMVATLGRYVSELGDQGRDALIDYVADHERVARDELLPPYLVKVVDELRDVRKAPFMGRGHTDVWERQLTVSLLAQALLHCTYDSLGASGRWWSLRLAARLARTLMACDGRSPGVPSFRLGLEVCDTIDTLESARRVLESTNPAYGCRSLARDSATCTADSVGNPMFVNREAERQQLTSALHDESSRIIVVTGARGVGKSKLVENVLQECVNRNQDQFYPKVRRHQASRAAEPDVKSLIDDIEQGVAPANRIRQGETLHTRLRAALDARQGRRIVIVIESVENLLDDSCIIQDRDLDDAFEAISTSGHAPVIVVLVSQYAPRSGTRNSWPSAAQPVPVHGLHSDFFRVLLNNLDSRKNGLSTLPQDDLEQLHRQLHGNPQLAELLDQVISLAGIRLDGIMQSLSAKPPKDIPQFLADKLIHSMPKGPRWVMFALAAFSTPVSDDAVIELLHDRLHPDEIQAALHMLATKQVIRKTGEMFHYVPTPDVEILAHLPAGDRVRGTVSDEDRFAFLHQAANVLSQRQQRTSEIDRVTDLDLHFAEVDILLKVHMYGEAHEVMEDMDKVLRRWNRGDRLLQQREAIQGKLDDDLAEMENYNALGDIYVSRGRLPDARTAYEKALECRDPDTWRGRWKIYANIAALHWECNETQRAAERYSDALAMATEHDDFEDQVVALEGLADCHRRRGRYADAVRDAEKALYVAQRIGFSRAANVALKLSRWHAELGRTADALRFVEVAKRETDEHGHESLRAACLDARADLALDDGDSGLDLAISTASQAINIARDQHDPVILLQARTTLCFAHLRRNNIDEADREIERAATYRRRRRSLIVLALQALVSLEQENSGKANKLFGQLVAETTQRLTLDESDFAAWDFKGVALCGQAGPGGSLEPAIRAFEAARVKTPPTPGLVGRLAFIVGRIGQRHSQPGQFQSVVDAITGTPVRPSGT
ncbi:MAG: tetratricopeptide repeat protein [Pseudonocardiaceae bacterium]